MKKTIKIVIISATYFEIEKIIQRLEKYDWIREDKYFKKSIILKKKSTELCFFWTGVGNSNANKNIRYFFKKIHESDNTNIFDKFILIGFAGALKLDLKVGEILEPKVFVCDDSSQKRIIFNRKNGKDVSLITTFRSLNKEDKKKYKDFDLVDMETFFVVKALLFDAVVNNISSDKIKVFKVVSDATDFEFPDKLEPEIFNIVFTEKNLIKKIRFFMFANKDLRTKMKIFEMYLNFLKARRKLTNFLNNYIKNEVENNA